MKTNFFLVELEIPEGVSIGEMVEEIKFAVEAMAGYYCMDDDMFYLNRESITVVHATRKRLQKALEG